MKVGYETFGQNRGIEHNLKSGVFELSQVSAIQYYLHNAMFFVVYIFIQPLSESFSDLKVVTKFLC